SPVERAWAILLVRLYDDRYRGPSLAVHSLDEREPFARRGDRTRLAVTYVNDDIRVREEHAPARGQGDLTRNADHLAQKRVAAHGPGEDLHPIEVHRPPAELRGGRQLRPALRRKERVELAQVRRLARARDAVIDDPYGDALLDRIKDRHCLRLA